MRAFKLILIIVLTSASSWATAYCVQTGNRIAGLVGVDGGDGKIYVDVSSGPNQCNCSDFRFTPENTDTDKVLSILLAAKMAEKTLRIDIKSQEDCRSAYRIYIE